MDKDIKLIIILIVIMLIEWSIGGYAVYEAHKPIEITTDVQVMSYATCMVDCMKFADRWVKRNQLTSEIRAKFLPIYPDYRPTDRWNNDICDSMCHSKGALEFGFMKCNPNASLIFTTYGGSLEYYGERNIIWWGDMYEDFITVMYTDNSTLISEILKDYCVNYILIWRGEIAPGMIIPESNIGGVFTYKFLNNVLNDTKDFKVVYQNQDNIIFEVL